MMRRLFWLIAGVLLGVTGYRRVTRLARTVALGGRRGPGPGRPRDLMRSAAEFAHDVREGVELYTDRHPKLAGRTLEGQQSALGVDNAKEGR